MRTKMQAFSSRGAAVRVATLALIVACAVAVLAGGTLAAQPQVVIGSAHPILAGQPDQQALLLGQKKVAKILGWKVTALDAQLSPTSRSPISTRSRRKRWRGSRRSRSIRRRPSQRSSGPRPRASPSSVSTPLRLGDDRDQAEHLLDLQAGRGRCEVHRLAEARRESPCHGWRRGARAALRRRLLHHRREEGGPDRARPAGQREGLDRDRAADRSRHADEAS